MSSVALDGSSTTGHAHFPPSTVSSQASTVSINGKGPILNGDSMVTHCDPNSCHGATAVAKQSTVFINGKPVCLVGDNTSCGDTISIGSSNVFVE